MPGSTCLCNAGWSGSRCEQQAECSGHGSRKSAGSAATSSSSCTCDPGWTGPECDVQAECPDPTCSGHGVCQSTGSCLCGPGYSGLKCELARTGCSLTGCGGHGVCDEVTSKCNCHAGFAGLTCETELWSCPSNCSGHGSCIGGFCACWPSWEGEACDSKQASLATAANATLELLSSLTAEEPDGAAAAKQAQSRTSGSVAGRLLIGREVRGDGSQGTPAPAASVVASASPSTASWIAPSPTQAAAEAAAAAKRAAADVISASDRRDAALPVTAERPVYGALQQILAAGASQSEHVAASSGPPPLDSNPEFPLELAQQPAVDGVLRQSQRKPEAALQRPSLLSQQRESQGTTVVSAPQGSNSGPSGAATLLMSILGARAPGL